MTFYEYTPDPPGHEFHDGDVLGMFIPAQSRYRMLFLADESGPTNYLYNTGSATPPEGNFSLPLKRLQQLHTLW